MQVYQLLSHFLLLTTFLKVSKFEEGGKKAVDFLFLGLALT